MSSTADSQSSGQSDQTEEGRVQSLDARFTAIESEQQQQRGLLEQIASKISGGGHPGGSGGGGGSQTPPPPAAAPGDMADQMRQAVRDVQAEAAQAEQDRQHAADHERLRRPPAEQAPREVMVKGKARLQHVLFGGDR